MDRNAVREIVDSITPARCTELAVRLVDIPSLTGNEQPIAECVHAILGEMDESHEFADMVFAAWVEASDGERPAAFDELGERIIEAKRQYEAVKTLDENLFGDEFVAG